MRRTISIFLFITVLLSCNGDKEEAAKYYNDLNKIYLEFESNRKQAISEGNQLLKAKFNSSANIDSTNYFRLKKQYKQIENSCRNNIEKIESIGPFQQDSSLMFKAIELYSFSASIFKHEFPEYIESIENDYIDHKTEENIKKALLKFVVVQKDLISTEIKFQHEYKLDIMLEALEKAYLEHVRNIEKAKQMIKKS
ncbi:hypothetical protein [Saccharicrinis aurantiacus]|uniref:hypothetical protein n=1 Tax=Saccharicrinis aurantiacus TaxID=1849719 RepID=UPI00094FFB0A|nr:hypothetical protein [Saccharicrinis aurantiacus]